MSSCHTHLSLSPVVVGHDPLQLRQHDFYLTNPQPLFVVDCVECRQLATYECSECNHRFCYPCFKQYHEVYVCIRCCLVFCCGLCRVRVFVCVGLVVDCVPFGWMTRCLVWDSGAFKRHNHILFDAGSLTCDSCRVRVAVSRCQTCCDGLCAECIRTTHSKGRRRQHVMIPVDGVRHSNLFAVDTQLEAFLNITEEQKTWDE